jgi:hypothetical protein
MIALPHSLGNGERQMLAVLDPLRFSARQRVYSLLWIFPPEMRGCVNGDQYGYYYSQGPCSATDYKNAVRVATIDPSGTSSMSDSTNLQYLAPGCVEPASPGCGPMGRRFVLNHF